MQAVKNNTPLFLYPNNLYERGIVFYVTQLKHLDLI
jgi:hypothetical protein